MLTAWLSQAKPPWGQSLMKGFETSREATTKIILIRTVSYVSSTISTTFMTKHRIYVGWSQSPSKCFFRLRGRISNLKSCSHICTHASRFHQNTFSIIWNCLSSQPIMYIKSTPLVACLQRLPHVEDLNKSSSNTSRFSLHVIAVHLMHRLQRRASCEASHQFPPELRHFRRRQSLALGRGCLAVKMLKSQSSQKSRSDSVRWMHSPTCWTCLPHPTSIDRLVMAHGNSWFPAPKMSLMPAFCEAFVVEVQSSAVQIADIRVNLHVVRKCMSRTVKAILSRFCFSPVAYLPPNTNP